MPINFDGEKLSSNQLPSPSGWTILLAPIHISEKTSGGIILAQDDVKAQEGIRFISKVLAMGPLAYTGDKFKPHPKATIIPFCKIGDIVVTGQYSGSTLPCRTEGKDYYLRVVNDDEIRMVVSDTSILNI